MVIMLLQWRSHSHLSVRLKCHPKRPVDRTRWIEVHSRRRYGWLWRALPVPVQLTVRAPPTCREPALQRRVRSPRRMDNLFLVRHGREYMCGTSSCCCAADHDVIRKLIAC